MESQQPIIFYNPSIEIAKHHIPTKTYLQETKQQAPVFFQCIFMAL